MSSSATFWAAKSIDVKSSQAAAHVAKPTTTLLQHKKNGMVLKGATNGVKKRNWADSDDDEDFMTFFDLSGRVNELEKVNSAKESYIADLITTVKEKNARITELESTFDKQKRRHADLQSVIDASASHNLELENEAHKQRLHVQRLVAEVAEKSRRIAVLETEADDHCATIAKLYAGNSSIQDSSHDLVPVKEAVLLSATPPAKSETQYEATQSLRKEELDIESDSEAPPEDTHAPIRPSAKTSPSEAAGLAADLSVYPVFVTAATVKHMPPPPPAPKLKMPIDISKFGKKPAAKTASPMKKVETTSDEAAKDGPAPDIDPTADIRTKHHGERVLFANGPRVKVKMGDAILATLPKYVLMQCSHKAFKHFSDDPDATTFILPADSMDQAAAKAHLQWMKEMTYQGRVYSITLHSDEKFDDKNLHVCRAARVLGLNNMYIGHFTKVFCDRIRSNVTSNEFFNKVAALAYPENDPLYDCLVNNLASLRTRNAAKKPDNLEALLKKHPGLQARIEKVEERIRKKQEGAQIAKSPAVVHVGKMI